MLESARLAKCAGVPQFVQSIEASDGASVIMMIVAALIILLAIVALVVCSVFFNCDM